MPTKISALTEATDLDGPVILPVVQGGVSKRVDIDRFLQRVLGPKEAIEFNQDALLEPDHYRKVVTLTASDLTMLLPPPPMEDGEYITIYSDEGMTGNVVEGRKVPGGTFITFIARGNAWKPWSNAAGNNGPTFLPGRYASLAPHIAAGTTLNANRVYWETIWIDEDVTLTELGAEISTSGGAGATMFLAVYGSLQSSVRPTGFARAVTAAIDASSGGTKISPLLNPDTRQPEPCLLIGGRYHSFAVVTASSTLKLSSPNGLNSYKSGAQFLNSMLKTSWSATGQTPDVWPDANAGNVGSAAIYTPIIKVAS